MPSHPEANMAGPAEKLPSYAQDVSPPFYGVDSDEEDSASDLQLNSREHVRPFRGSSFSLFEQRRRAFSRHNGPDLELGFMTHEQYELTDTGRGITWGVDGSNTYRLSSASDTSAPSTSRGAPGRNCLWPSAPSQSPPDYHASEILAVAAATSPASTATPTPDASSASTPARNTPADSSPSSPGSPVPESNTHIPVTEPPSPPSQACLVPDPWSDPTPSALPGRLAPARTRTSFRSPSRSAVPVEYFPPIPPLYRDPTTSAARPRHGTAQAAARRSRRRRSDHECTCRWFNWTYILWALLVAGCVFLLFSLLSSKKLIGG
jgi:hypothetical protein